jgi:hypothetical protein
VWQTLNDWGTGKNTEKQVKLLVAINLFVSTPSHRPFPRTMEKSSGEWSLILRLKGTKYDILLTSLSW